MDGAVGVGVGVGGGHSRERERRWAEEGRRGARQHGCKLEVKESREAGVT